MKRTALFAATAIFAVGAYAQGGRGSYIQVHPLLSALDANHDGVIDEDELAKAPAALRALDKNGDGRITAGEMSPAMGRGRGGPEGRGGRGREEGGEGPQNANSAIEDAVKTFLAFDKNGDGKLTKDEVPERMQGIFERGDANHDGVLTADELRTLARAQTATAPGGRGGEREGERREGGEGRGRGPEGMRPEGMRPVDPIFAALDTNHDGAIAGDEITKAAESLKVLDKNHDGKISEDEVRPNFGPGRGRG